MRIRLNEQSFTNKNKVWYRGRDIIDTGFKNWDCLFLTTSIGYAYGYASNSKDGFVEKRTLNNVPLNIFNAQNPSEFKLIEKHFPNYANQLKKGNWYEILGPEKRAEFLEILKNLKYDGFINFEDDDDSAVSVGIFDPKNTKIVGKMSLEDVRNTQDFKHSYMLERRFVYNAIKIHFIEGKTIIYFNKQLRIIKEKELKKIFNNLKESKTFPQANAKLILRKNCCSKFLL